MAGYFAVATVGFATREGEICRGIEYSDCIVCRVFVMSNPYLSATGDASAPSPYQPQPQPQVPPNTSSNSLVQGQGYGATSPSAAAPATGMSNNNPYYQPPPAAQPVFYPQPYQQLPPAQQQPVHPGVAAPAPQNPMAHAPPQADSGNPYASDMQRDGHYAQQPRSGQPTAAPQKPVGTPYDVHPAAPPLSPSHHRPQRGHPPRPVHRGRAAPDSLTGVATFGDICCSACSTSPSDSAFTVADYAKLTGMSLNQISSQKNEFCCINMCCCVPLFVGGCLVVMIESIFMALWMAILVPLRYCPILCTSPAATSTCLLKLGCALSCPAITMAQILRMASSAMVAPAFIACASVTEKGGNQGGDPIGCNAPCTDHCIHIVKFPCRYQYSFDDGAESVYDRLVRLPVARDRPLECTVFKAPFVAIAALITAMFAMLGSLFWCWRNTCCFCNATCRESKRSSENVICSMRDRDEIYGCIDICCCGSFWYCCYVPFGAMFNGLSQVGQAFLSPLVTMTCNSYEQAHRYDCVGCSGWCSQDGGCSTCCAGQQALCSCSGQMERDRRDQDYMVGCCESAVFPMSDKGSRCCNLDNA